MNGKVKTVIPSIWLTLSHSVPSHDTFGKILKLCSQVETGHIMSRMYCSPVETHRRNVEAAFSG